MTKLKLVLVSILMSTSIIAQDVDPKDIIRKAEEKTRGVKSSFAEMTITTVRKKWSREMSMKSWSKGQDFSMILITAPAKCAALSVPLTPLTTTTELFTVSSDTQRISSVSHSIIVPASIASFSS